MKDRSVLYRAVEHMVTNQFRGHTCHGMNAEFTTQPPDILKTLELNPTPTH